MTEKPVFDFNRVGREWAKAFNQSVQEATRAQMQIRQLTNIKPTTLEQMDELDKRYRSASELIEKASETQAQLVAQVLVSVPSTWLTHGSKEDLEGQALLERISPDKYAELLMLLQTGEAYKNSKN